MAAMSKSWYRERAEEVLKEKGLNGSRGKDNDKIMAVMLPDCDVSCGSSPGGWVQIWLWIPDPVLKKENKI